MVPGDGMQENWWTVNGVKEIELIFDEDIKNKKYNLFLWKGLGIDYFNYYQTIKCDENYLKKLSNKYLKLKNDINLIIFSPICFNFPSYNKISSQ